MLGLGLLGGLFWQGAESTLVHAAFATYRTATGERRRWTLADGSSLWLNTSSAVSLDFSTNLRGMQLIEGEVALDARAELRPLQLVTPDTVLRSQDANLLVRHDQQGSRITVLRGLVEVSSRHTPSPLTVAAGWQILVDSQGADAPRQTDGFLAQAWVRGILPAERMRLDVLLAELSRYRPGILRCSEQVAALRVTGSFQLDDTDAALKLLAHALPVRIERRTRYWVTLVPV
jgi:transmembrane sensor